MNRRDLLKYAAALPGLGWLAAASKPCAHPWWEWVNDRPAYRCSICGIERDAHTSITTVDPALCTK